MKRFLTLMAGSWWKLTCNSLHRCNLLQFSRLRSDQIIISRQHFLLLLQLTFFLILDVQELLDYAEKHNWINLLMKQCLSPTFIILLHTFLHPFKKPRFLFFIFLTFSPFLNNPIQNSNLLLMNEKTMIKLLHYLLMFCFLNLSRLFF